MDIFTDTTKSSDEIASTAKTSSGQSVPASQSKEIYEGVPIPLLKKLYRGITYPIRLLPDFMIIGTQRGGTTSLYRYLKSHPCVGATSNKDLHFFDRRFSKGLSWYRGHFPTWIEKYYAQMRGQVLVTGEASPSYLFHPHAPKRVAQVLPHVKLIVLLRNPVDRAYSQYNHAVELGYEASPSFEEAIEGEEERTAREHEKILKDENYYSEQYKHQSYLTKGIYVDQLKVWMELFPREQFLILKSEDFYADPAASFKETLAFLNLAGVEVPMGEKAFKQYNNNSYSSKMDPATRKRLIKYFKPYNERLYDLLGVNFGWDK